MAKSITDIKQELGITSSSTIDDLFTLASQYKVFSQAEINNIKAISVLPLANSVRDKADELKQRFTDIVLNENKGQIHGINVRIVIILELLEKLNTLAGTLSEDKADKVDVYSKDDTYNKTEEDALLDQKQDVLTFDSTPTANSTNPVTSGGVKTALDLKADKADVYNKDEVDTKDLNLAVQIAGARVELNNRINTTDGILTATQAEVAKLKSVQNVVEVVATKSALNSYDTSKLEENDKIQVIADETHDGASTVYNWNGSAWQYVGAYGTNSYTKPETIEQIDLHKLVNKTYSELAILKSGNNLVPGQLYRITDYVTLTNGMCNNVGNDARSAQHPFDIIVRATATNKFSEQARAIQHTSDAYFGNSNLQAWQLWYCFDNDSNRFEWADTSTGKGVIYRMIDEFGNDLPYDFKNIQFKRYKITATSDQRQVLFVGKYLGFSGNYAVVSDNSDYVWYYTFSKRSDGSDLSLTETTASDIVNSYYVKQVIIGQYLTDTPNYRGAQALNNIVMEADNIIVDVQMGAGSHHNTWIGNKDIDYCYFREMFRQNILFGEINHTRADECFERNVMGEGHYSNYTSCWNKFSHHFSQNTSLNLQSNDFENQVGNCKFPEHFTRNHVSNMWDNVNAGTHDTFNRCEFGYMVNVTLSGAGDWDGVKVLMLYNVTLKIANFYGSTVGRMEYVTITEDVNAFKILNLTIGALYGSSSTQLTIALTDLYSYNLTTAYEKRLDYALEPINSLRVLVYSVKVKGTYIVQDKCVVGNIITSTGNVTWTLANTIEERIDAIYDGLFNIKMAKQNPTGSGAISMNDGTSSGTNSYANGSGANASGIFSRAIGFGATASGGYSLAVMGNASGSGSVAYGNTANASGDGSFALGTQCKAKGNNQVVTGKFNIPDTTSLEIVGNGAYMNTKNARVLDSNGNEFLAGDLYLDTEFSKDSNGDLLSKQGMSVKQTIKNIQSALEGNLYNETIDNGIAYEVALSNPLPYGKVNKIGGMSYKSENLWNTSFSGNEYNVSATITGLKNNTTYILKFWDNTVASNLTLTGATLVSVSGYQTRETAIFTTTDTTVIIALAGGSTSNKLNEKVNQRISLNEGSTALPYEPYFSGIRNTAVSQLTIRGVNLANINFETRTVNGVTYTLNSDKSATLSGTSTARSQSLIARLTLPAGTYTLVNFGNNRDKADIFAVYTYQEQVTYIDLTGRADNYRTFTLPDQIEIGIQIDVRTANIDTTGTVIKAMLVQGSTAPTQYKPYVTPIIKPIPSEIQALDGYGWGISESVCNYIDYDRKVFVQKVGKITITADTFMAVGTTGGTQLPVASFQVGTPLDMKSVPLASLSSLGAVISRTDGAYWGHTDTLCYDGGSTPTRIQYVNSNMTSEANAKAICPFDVYFELATPIETDVSQYLTDENYDVLSNLEPNGSITLDNTYQQEAVYDITTLEKVSV